MTHTPGPWVLTDGFTVYALDETKSCNRFSTLINGGWVHRPSGSTGALLDRTTDEELRANARLIAAAPDLLEALQRIMAEDSEDCWQQARAAIAKARGE